MPVTETPKNPSLRVMARPAFVNRHLNPYNALLYDPMVKMGLTVEEYDPWRIFGPKIDILHVHWPESRFNHALLGARIDTQKLLAVLEALRLRGTRLVYTLHNLRAHDRRYPEVEERFWRRFMRRVDGVLALTKPSLTLAADVHPELADIPTFVVPHPHYRTVYEDRVSRAEARAQLDLPANGPVFLYFGLIKAYKNVPALVSTFRRLPENYTLVIAGRPRDEGLERAVNEAAEGDPRVRLRLEHVPTEEAQLYFRASSLVTLPYTDILNSGAALLALSFDRPVWLPDGPLVDELRRITGPDWIWSGALDEGALQRAAEDTMNRPDRTDGQHVAVLDPERIAQETVAAYRAIVETPR